MRSHRVYRQRLFCVLAVLSAAALLGAVPAQASITVGFTCLTNNDPGDAAIGETQLLLEIADLGAGQVLFQFSNTGPEPSVLTRVYFQDLDGIFSGIVDLGTFDEGQVSFIEGGSPPSLPGGKVIDFIAAFRASADNPAPKNGVGPGEKVGIVVGLQSCETFEEVLAGVSSGNVRAGVRVQAYESGGSEGFVNDPPDGIGLVPEPSSLVVWSLLGVVGMSVYRRRSRIAS